MKSSPVLMALLACLLLMTSLPALAAISVSVNRNHIDITDALILSVQVDTSPGYDKPDFSPLNRDWRILATNQRVEISYNNGRKRSVTIWQLTLVPQRQGNLIIPALQWRNDSAPSIAVRVTPIAPSLQQQLDKLLFFRTQVIRPERVWVQSQIVYRVELYYAQGVQLDKNKILMPPTPDNARVQALGQASSGREQRQGVFYWVVRQNYAIFPQISGQLKLMPESMVGYARLAGYGNQRKTITVQSKGHIIDVLPKPPEYPADKPWLPAQGVHVTGDLTPTSSTTVGTAINLQLKLEAQGAAGSLLPHFPEFSLVGARIYKQPFELVEELNSGGVKGRMTLDLAIIPTQPGTLKIPPVRFSWWDTNGDRLREASWQGIDIEVTGQPIVPATAQPEIARQPPAVIAQPSYGLAWLSLVLGGCWLLTLGYIWWLKHSVLTATASALPGPGVKEEKESKHFRRLVRACEQNDAAAAKQALQLWASHSEVGDGSPMALNNLLCRDIAGQKLLDELNRHLYRSQENGFEGSGLLQWAQNKRTEQLDTKAANKPKLAAFYPDTRTA